MLKNDTVSLPPAPPALGLCRPRSDTCFLFVILHHDKCPCARPAVSHQPAG